MSVKEKERGGGSELGSDQDLVPDPDPRKILRIRIRQNYADPDLAKLCGSFGSGSATLPYSVGKPE